MYNRVILMGRLVADPELRHTSNNTPVATFRIAVDRRFQNKGEERQSDFFNIVAWNHSAEFISKYFTKGKAILIEGEIQNRTYVNKDGEKRYITEVIVDSARFTYDSKNSGGGGGYSAESHPANTVNTPPAFSSGTTDDFTANDDDDDYPF